MSDYKGIKEILKKFEEKLLEKIAFATFSYEEVGEDKTIIPSGNIKILINSPTGSIINISLAKNSIVGSEVILIAETQTQVTYNSCDGTSVIESMEAGCLKRLFATTKGYIVNHYDAVWN